MHQTVLLPAQTLNGIYKSHPLEGAVMDTDKVVDILMQLQKEGSARDVKLDNVIAGQREINEFRIGYVRTVDTAMDEFRRRDSDFGRRLESLEKANLDLLTERVSVLEKSGLRGWLEGSTAKRLGTLTALVVGIAAALLVITQALAWLKVHLHF